VPKDYKKVVLKNGEVRYVFDVSLGFENGKRKRTTVRAKTIKEGRLKVAQLTAHINSIKDKDSIIFSDAFSIYREYAVKRLSANTVISIDTSYKKYECFYDRKLNQITHRDVESWFYRLGNNASSNNSYLARLKAFFNFCIKREMISFNPATSIEKFKESTAECDFITESEMISIYNVISQKYKITLLTLFYTGLRIGELAGLSLADFDDNDHMIHLHHTRKGDQISNEFKNEQSKRTVPCPKKLFEMLKQYICSSKEEYPFFSHYRNFYLPLRRASKKAIGRYIHPHTLRHSYASMMINQGIDIYTLSRLLGHSNIGTTTKVYSHLYKDKLIEISEKLELNGVIK
jgi:integrase